MGQDPKAAANGPITTTPTRRPGNGADANGQDASEWGPADWNAGTITAELAAFIGHETSATIGDEPDPGRAFFRPLYSPPRMLSRGSRT
jgi:hypothetical protein